MLLNPERISGWDTSTYVIIALVVIAAFAAGYINKKHKHTNLCVILLSLLLVILCKVALSFQLGGTDLFFLEWMAYFGELLLFLPVFVGYLLGFLIKLVTLSHKHTNQKETQTQ